MANEKNPIEPQKKVDAKGTTSSPVDAKTTKTPSKSAPKSTAAKNATKSTTPKTSAPKTTAPKVATPVTPKNAPNIVNSGVTSNGVTPKAPTPQGNVSAESAKEAELQSKVAEGAQTNTKKKKGVKKLIFLLLLLILIAGIAVTAVLVIPNLLKEQTPMPELELTNPGEEGIVQDLNFEEPVDDYIWGETIPRGIAVKNTGEAGILLCFKLEIYANETDDVPLDIVATPGSADEVQIWTKKTVTEVLGDKPINTVYYYYNYVLDSNSPPLILFENYTIDAEDEIANQFGKGDEVSSRVTVQYIDATIESLNSTPNECWQQADSAWKARIRELLNNN